MTPKINRSSGGNDRRPGSADAVNLLDEPTTCDLRRGSLVALASMAGHMLIGRVEGVSQELDVSRLQSLKRL